MRSISKNLKESSRFLDWADDTKIVQPTRKNQSQVLHSLGDEDVHAYHNDLLFTGFFHVRASWILAVECRDSIILTWICTKLHCNNRFITLQWFYNTHHLRSSFCWREQLVLTENTALWVRAEQINHQKTGKSINKAVIQDLLDISKEAKYINHEF